ncbi:MAG: response regulator, partial [Pseudomonadota bacterium]
PRLDTLLASIFKAHEQGEPPWKILFEELGDFFDERFGSDWKDKDKSFWTEFEITYQISKGMAERLKHDERVTSRGI